MKSTMHFDISELRILQSVQINDCVTSTVIMMSTISVISAFIGNFRCYYSEMMTEFNVIAIFMC